MAIAKTSIGRVLKVLKNLQDYLASKIAKPQVAESTADGKGGELQSQYVAYDRATATGSLHTSAGRFEQVAQFCLARDYRNTRRSRRYIYSRAHQERLRASLNGVMEFAVQNSDIDLEKIAAQNPDALTSLDLATMQKLYPA